MSQRRVTVIIDGEEYVSKAAREADEGVKKFSDRIPGYAKVAAKLTAAWFAIQGAFNAVRSVVTSSFEAFDTYEKSLRKLDGTSRITGVPINTLAENARRARDEFKLSTAQANDLAIVNTLLANAAGDAGKGYDLLAKSIELGAARGLDAQQTLEALEITLRGQDEGLDRLLNKNPSDLYKAWADSAGRTVGTMTEQEKKLAIVTALMDAGAKVGGTYADFLDSAAGRQFVLNARLEDVRITLAKALMPLREFGVELMSALAGNTNAAVGPIGGMTQALVGLARAIAPVIGPLIKLGDILTSGLAVAFGTVSVAIQTFAYESEKDIAEWAIAIGRFFQKAGDYLKVFGIDVVGDTADSLIAWGERTRREALSSLGDVQQQWIETQRTAIEAGRRWRNQTWPDLQDINRGLGMVADAAESTGTAVERGAKKAGQAVSRELGPTLVSMIRVTERSFDELGTAASSSLEPQIAVTFNGQLAQIAANAEAVRARVTAVKPPMEDAGRSGERLARDIASTARAGIDLAQAFGMADTQAASMLNSIVNMGESLGRVLSGDVAGGVTGIVGAAANLVTQITAGDAERRRLLRDNSTQLARLRDTIGDLDLNVSGDDFASAFRALNTQETTDIINRAIGGDRDGAFRQLTQLLSAQGLTFGDLQRIATEIGVSLVDANGKIQYQALSQLFTALGSAEFGQFGTDFQGQLRSVQASFGVFGTDTRGQLQALGNLFGQFSPALAGLDLTNLPGTRLALQDLFTGLQTGQIGPDQFGQLTGTQFLDAITTLLDLVRQLEGEPPPAVTAPPAATVDAPAGPPIAIVAPASESAATEYLARATAYFGDALPLLARTADATEETADNTAAALGYLADIRSRLGTGLDESLGQTRELAARAAGDGSL